MAREDRRDYDRGDRYGDNNDRGGYPDNNFDKNYDSSGYNVRGGRSYPPREEFPQEPPRGRNYPQQPRQYDNQSYRPMEDVQLQEREMTAPKMREREPQSPPQMQQPIINTTGASNILVSYPKTYQEVKQLIDSLRSKQAVIIDIIKLEPDAAQRVLDFMSGANYALCGSMQRLNTTMFVFTPGGVSIKIPYDIDKKR